VTTDATSGPRVQILHVAGCPLVDRLRETTRRASAQLARAIRIEEEVGDFPSPTLLVDGVDVVTGRPVAANASCRFDVPTEEQVVAALRAAMLRARQATASL